MSIQSRLNLLTAFCVLLALVIGIILLYSYNHVTDTIKRDTTANNVLRGVFELNIITNDYLATHSKRAHTQWKSRHSSLGELIRVLEDMTPENSMLFDEIQRHHSRLLSVFMKLTKNRTFTGTDEEQSEMSLNLEKKITNQLLNRTQLFVTAVERSYDQTHNLAVATQTKYFLLVLVLSGAMIVTIVISLLTFGRGIVKSITILRQSTGKIANSDFQHRVDIQTKDEIGGLAKDFDNMADRLALMTVSKDELEERVDNRTSELRSTNLLLNQEIEVRKKAEKSLQISEERLKGIFENTKNCIAVYQAVDDGDDFIFVDFNKEAEKTEKISKEHLIGKRLTHIFPGVKEFGLLDALKQVHQTGKPRFHPITMYKDDRISGWRDNFIFKLASGEVIAVYSDETEKMKASQALIESEEKYRSLYESNMDGIIHVSMDGNIIECNQTLLDMLGYSLEELRKLSYQELTPEKWHAMETEIVEKEVLVKGYCNEFEKEYRHKDGRKIPIAIKGWASKNQAGEYQSIWGLVRNISKIKEAEVQQVHLESQIRQAHKMEAIGTLANGIAHDFNNILGAIIGYAELIEMSEDLQENGRTRHDISEILKAAMRAKSLVRQILAFARQTDHERKPVVLGNIIKETLGLLRASIPSTIKIKQNLFGTGLVMADPTQLQQIIMNLCTNAAHAMRHKGGVLEVTLSKWGVEKSQQNQFCLTVKDTGKGMDPLVIERIFDPYFTTKEKSEGTGLGLSLVHGIVKSYDGEIRVDSVVGKGSKFSIYLPCIDGSREISRIPKRKSLPRGNETILFVDDEIPLVESINRGLRLLGYKVHVTNSSLDALEMFKAQPEIFDLVITDRTMPAMNGFELAQKIKAIRPGIDIILCTGFMEEEDDETCRRIGITKTLLKPIEYDQMATTIREVLDG